MIRTAAECQITGEISANADWNEDIYFFGPDGSAQDLTDLDFYMQFRCDPKQDAADITLSTDDGTLSLEDDGGSVTSILRITVADGVFSNYIGDMILDIVSVDAAGTKTHCGHGVVTILNDPATI